MGLNYHLYVYTVLYYLNTSYRAQISELTVYLRMVLMSCVPTRIEWSPLRPHKFIESEKYRLGIGNLNQRSVAVFHAHSA